MREIEKKVIDSDAELQSIVEQIKSLHNQLRERLENKLVGDTEYQNLKNKLKTMQEKWKERHPKIKERFQQ